MTKSARRTRWKPRWRRGSTPPIQDAAQSICRVLTLMGIRREKRSTPQELCSSSCPPNTWCDGSCLLALCLSSTSTMLRFRSCSARRMFRAPASISCMKHGTSVFLFSLLPSGRQSQSGSRHFGVAMSPSGRTFFASGRNRRLPTTTLI